MSIVLCKRKQKVLCEKTGCGKLDCKYRWRGCHKSIMNCAFDTRESRISGVVLMKVEFNSSEIETMQAALDQWGLTAQIGQAVEECAELIVALQKYVNRTSQAGSGERILDEIADVEMMLAQIRLALNIDDETLRGRIERKFSRLDEYLAKDTV